MGLTSISFRADSVWNNKVKAKPREEITLADKENFSSGDIDCETCHECFVCT